MQTANTSNIPINDHLATKLTPIVMAGMLGLAVVFLTGFLNVESVHNAAHDTRHSASFPCH